MKKATVVNKETNSGLVVNTCSIGWAPRECAFVMPMELAERLAACLRDLGTKGMAGAVAVAQEG